MYPIIIALTSSYKVRREECRIDCRAINRRTDNLRCKWIPGDVLSCLIRIFLVVEEFRNTVEDSFGSGISDPAQHLPSDRMKIFPD